MLACWRRTPSSFFPHLWEAGPLLPTSRSASLSVSTQQPYIYRILTVPTFITFAPHFHSYQAAAASSPTPDVTPTNGAPIAEPCTPQAEALAAGHIVLSAVASPTDTPERSLHHLRFLQLTEQPTNYALSRQLPSSAAPLILSRGLMLVLVAVGFVTWL